MQPNRIDNYLIGACNGRQANVNTIIFSKFHAAHDDAVQIERKCRPNVERHFQKKNAQRKRRENHNQNTAILECK